MRLSLPAAVSPLHGITSESESDSTDVTLPLTEYPLLIHQDPEDLAAIVDGRPVSVAEFLASVWALRAQLPTRPYVVNVCEDRYRFTVGLAAAMIAGQISLMPTCRAPESLRRLALEYPDAYVLTDRPVSDAGLPQVLWPQHTPMLRPSTRIPWFPSSQTALVVFTSGTTGTPLAHAKTWGSLVRGAQAFGSHFGLANLPARVVVGTVPPQHMFGLESTVILPLQRGWAIHATRRTLSEDLRRDCAMLSSPTWLMTTPLHLRSFEALPEALPNIEGIISATMPLDAALAASLERRWTVPIYEVYGCTEGGIIGGRRPAYSTRWRLCPNLQLHREDQRVYVSGGHVGHRIPLADRLALLNEREFTLCGRDADLVKIAGKRISLTLLNSYLSRIPGVLDGVFFQPPAGGDSIRRLCAAVVAPGLDRRDIVSSLRRYIDPVFLPRPLYLVDRLPRSESGKLPSAQLQAYIQQIHTTRSPRVRA